MPSNNLLPVQHQDPGLQPERTSLAWGRTMMALITVSAIFLRWLPHHGLPILALFGVAAVAAAGIYLTQRRRYRTSSRGISSEQLSADAGAVLWTTVACVALGGLGITIVVAG
ncbi:DUF202 domain-containing protein [Pseudarthrobacter sp. J75]|uniref:DUF202 domain-containing protein n=1 Tax=unclassified Pseudarthrobacter TaxID=2647000 RepID=UPI002E8163DD|nr:MULTISPECIES: DUF202 domain-containing protein [unclassified Pseudarthrobacter]MEE2522330.1 DUF202 domain-containing protein [Pseudarthrobacter sp. J47]MEE2528024.1 DUF202 domain-containing protein [Pseudarthrobacter sp. J75]